MKLEAYAVPGLPVCVERVAGLDVEPLEVVEHDHELGAVDGRARGQNPVVRLQGDLDVRRGVGRGRVAVVVLQLSEGERRFPGAAVTCSIINAPLNW